MKSLSLQTSRAADGSLVVFVGARLITAPSALWARLAELTPVEEPLPAASDPRWESISEAEARGLRPTKAPTGVSGKQLRARQALATCRRLATLSEEDLAFIDELLSAIPSSEGDSALENI